MKLATPIIVVLALSAIAFAACGSDDAGVTDLDGTTWGEATVEGYELAGTLDIMFDDGTMSVTGGCNTMNGAYSIDDGVLTAGPMAMTMMACPDPLMDQDTWFAGLLDAGLDVMMDGDDLVLSADDVTITLQPAG